MASIKTTMIAAIRSAVESIPNMGTFRAWNGQFDNNKDHPIKYPCVLWEFSQLDWVHKKNPNGVGDFQYSDDAQIIFHIGVRSLGIDPHIDNEVFEITDSVAAAIATVSAESFGKFRRLSETQDTQHETVVDNQLTFQFSIMDCETFAQPTTTGMIKTLQEHGDIQSAPPNAVPNFESIPQYGTDNPDD